MRVIGGEFRSRRLHSMPGMKSVQRRTACAKRCSISSGLILSAPYSSMLMRVPDRSGSKH